MDWFQLLSTCDTFRARRPPRRGARPNPAGSPPTHSREGREKTMESNRRTVIKAMAAAGMPFILPSRIWAADTPPNGRLGVGFIGMGIQSRGLLGSFLHEDVQVLAVCDVDTTRREAARKRVDEFYAAFPRQGPARLCGVQRLPRAPRPQGHRRGVHRHSGSLARHHHPRAPCRRARTSTARSPSPTTSTRPSR